MRRESAESVRLWIRLSKRNPTVSIKVQKVSPIYLSVCADTRPIEECGLHKKILSRKSGKDFLNFLALGD